MTTAQPQTIANRIASELNNVTPQTDKFTLRRINAEIDRLEQADYATATAIRGSLAAMLWDKTSCIECYQDSLAHRNTTETNLNFAKSLLRLNDFHQAMQQLESSINAGQMSIELIKAALFTARSIADLSRIQKYSDQLDRMMKNQQNVRDYPKQERVQMMTITADNQELNGLIAKIDLPHDEIDQVLSIATRIAYEHQVQIRSVHLWLDPTSCTPYIFHDLQVSTDAETYMKMCDAYHDALIKENPAAIAKGNYYPSYNLM